MAGIIKSLNITDAILSGFTVSHDRIKFIHNGCKKVRKWGMLLYKNAKFINSDKMLS